MASFFEKLKICYLFIFLFRYVSCNRTVAGYIADCCGVHCGLLRGTLTTVEGYLVGGRCGKLNYNRSDGQLC